MFLSIEELVDQAKAYPSVAELMIAVEMEMRVLLQSFKSTIK